MAREILLPGPPALSASGASDSRLLRAKATAARMLSDREVA
jgi:hypothetical protein